MTEKSPDTDVLSLCLQSPFYSVVLQVPSNLLRIVLIPESRQRSHNIRSKFSFSTNRCRSYRRLVLHRCACCVINFAWPETTGVPRGSQRVQQKRHIKSHLLHPVYWTIRVKGRVKQSLYRPGQNLRVPWGCCSQISRQSAHEGGKTVSLTHQPLLPHRKYSWYSFLLQTVSTPGSECDRKDYVNDKFQWPHREQNPRPSGL
jgi:hypothetical protein